MKKKREGAENRATYPKWGKGNRVGIGPIKESKSSPEEKMTEISEPWSQKKGSVFQGGKNRNFRFWQLLGSSNIENSNWEGRPKDLPEKEGERIRKSKPFNLSRIRTLKKKWGSHHLCVYEKPQVPKEKAQKGGEGGSCNKHRLQGGEVVLEVPCHKDLNT